MPKTTYNKILPAAFAVGFFYIALCKIMDYNLYIGLNSMASKANSLTECSRAKAQERGKHETVYYSVSFLDNHNINENWRRGVVWK